MDPITATPVGVATTDAARPASFGDLSSADFLQLLIQQITNQDPLDPMGNQELLDQIATIREIEMSTSLTSTLQTLSDQQRFGSASMLIGRYVTGSSGADGQAVGGVVERIRMDAGGQAVLQLADGTLLGLDQVQSIESAQRAAEALVGMHVVGLDRRDPSDPQSVEGVVTAAREDEAGRAVLELDTGEDLRFIDVLRVSAMLP